MNKSSKQRQVGQVGIESKVEINVKCIYKCSTVKIVDHPFHRRKTFTQYIYGDLTHPIVWQSKSKYQSCIKFSYQNDTEYFLILSVIWFINTSHFLCKMVHIHIEFVLSGVSLTSSRGISPFLHSLGQGMMNLPQTVRCDSSCSTSMGMLQKSHLTSLLGQSSCRCFLSMDFSSSAPQRLGHITGTNLQSSKWACQRSHSRTHSFKLHINRHLFICIFN